MHVLLLTVPVVWRLAGHTMFIMIRYHGACPNVRDFDL
jgi:hypothetical protein